MPYDNIKNDKKPGFYTLFRKYIFQKTTGGVKLTPPAVLRLRHTSEWLVSNQGSNAAPSHKEHVKDEKVQESY